jgi:hypothetical protein
VLPALTSDGIIALDSFKGSVNKEHFMDFLNKELVSVRFVMTKAILNNSTIGPQAVTIPWSTKCGCFG